MKSALLSDTLINNQRLFLLQQEFFEIMALVKQ
jgi:hypothetical protein